MATRTFIVHRCTDPAGPTEVKGEGVGRTMCVHRPLSDGETTTLRSEWAVSHQRTGLLATIRTKGKDDAKAYAAGFDRILRHFGDAGEPGKGDVLMSGTRGRAINRYHRVVRAMPDQWLSPSNRLINLRLDRQAAIELAEAAIREEEF